MFTARRVELGEAQPDSSAGFAGLTHMSRVAGCGLVWLALAAQPGELTHSGLLSSSSELVKNAHMEMAEVQTNKPEQAGFLKT